MTQTGPNPSRGFDGEPFDGEPLRAEPLSRTADDRGHLVLKLLPGGERAILETGDGPIEVSLFYLDGQLRVSLRAPRSVRIRREGPAAAIAGGGA